jgi:uncharacterized repeat protein (TIGR01451 family)
MKKNQQEPLVSIVIPTASSKTLKSLLVQSYSNLEIIVLNERSCSIKDKRIRFLRFSKNTDPFYALNFALKKARGKFLGIMESEDISFPDRIERQVEFLLANPETVLIGGQVFLLKKNGEVFGERGCVTSFFHNPVLLSAALINRKLLPKEFVFYSSGSKREGDLELSFRLKQYGRMASLERKVLYHRYPESSFAWKNLKKDFIRTARVRKKAIAELGYQPEFLEKMTYTIEKLIVNLLPSKVAYSLLESFSIKKVKQHEPGLAKGWRSVSNGNLLREIPKFRIVLTLLLAVFVLTRSCAAAIRCETQYGGGETCHEVKELILDKKVWDPVNLRFEDNLVDVSPDGFRFIEGDRVIYRIRVKNESDKTIENIQIQDTLPSYLKHDQGELSFKIDKLAPGQAEEKQIEALVESVPANGQFDCGVENAVTAKNDNYDLRDTSRICVGGERIIEITILPKTGAAAILFTLCFSLVSGLLGLYLVNLKRKA